MTLNPARLARFSDWAHTLTPRPLPRTAVPVAGEYHLDYVMRLAHANHLEFLQLCDALHNPGANRDGRLRWEQNEQERLAAAAGQPLARISRLYWPNPAMSYRDPTGLRRGLRPACRRCTARHHTGTPILCQLPDHVTVCRRHRLWIGPDIRTADEQVYLGDFLPEYLTAQRRHQRLHQQHQHATAAAWRRAEAELHQKLYRHRATNAQQHRLDHFCPKRRPGDNLHQPGVAGALYPDLVRRTVRLLTVAPVHPPADRQPTEQSWAS